MLSCNGIHYSYVRRITKADSDMKYSIIVACALVVLSSCTKDDASPTVEEIKKGSKWGIEIGKSAAEV